MATEEKVRTIFADTVFWGAMFYLKDPYHAEAMQVRFELGTVQLVTTDEVLTEVLDGFSQRGAYWRSIAVKAIDDIFSDRAVTVYPQSRESFLAALQLYRTRQDKEYSLVDCSSMATMRRRSIKEILTNDRHLTQQGFRILMGGRRHG
jgi:uncharacterized protein